MNVLLQNMTNEWETHHRNEDASTMIVSGLLAIQQETTGDIDPNSFESEQQEEHFIISKTPLPCPAKGECSQMHQICNRKAS